MNLKSAFVLACALSSPVSLADTQTFSGHVVNKHELYFVSKTSGFVTSIAEVGGNYQAGSNLFELDCSDNEYKMKMLQLAQQKQQVKLEHSKAEYDIDQELGSLTSKLELLTKKNNVTLAELERESINVEIKHLRKMLKACSQSAQTTIFVTEVFRGIGEAINSGDKLLGYTHKANMELEVKVPIRYLNQISIGDVGRIDGYDDELTITRISAKIDDKTQFGKAYLNTPSSGDFALGARTTLTIELK